MEVLSDRNRRGIEKVTGLGLVILLLYSLLVFSSCQSAKRVRLGSLFPNHRERGFQIHYESEEIKALVQLLTNAVWLEMDSPQVDFGVSRLKRFLQKIGAMSLLPRRKFRLESLFEPAKDIANALKSEDAWAARTVLLGKNPFLSFNLYGRLNDKDVTLKVGIYTDGEPTMQFEWRLKGRLYRAATWSDSLYGTLVSILFDSADLLTGEEGRRCLLTMIELFLAAGGLP